MTTTWQRLAAFALVLSTGACGDSTTTTDDDTDTDTDTTTTGGCLSGLAATDPTFPAANATDVYYRSTFTVNFNQDEKATAAFTLTDSTGGDVALATATFSDDGKTAYFKSSAPLTPGASYTWNISYSCDKSLDVPFTVSATGAAVDTEDVVGTTYAIDISTAVFLEPPGVGDILASFISGPNPSFEVPPILVVPSEYNADDDTLTFFGGIGEGTPANPTQDLCTPTLEFGETPADFSENPYFILDSDGNLPLPEFTEGLEITLLNLVLSGAFTPTGDSVVGVELFGSLDTRDIASLIPGGAGEDAACSFLAAFVECEACPSNAPNGPGDFCLTLRATNITAEAVDGFTLVPRTAEEIAADTETCPPE